MSPCRHLALLAGVSGSGSGIAHFAHLGGFAAGYVYLRWRKRKYLRQWQPMATPKAQLAKAAAENGDGDSLKVEVHPVRRAPRIEPWRGGAITAKASSEGVLP